MHANVDFTFLAAEQVDRENLYFDGLEHYRNIFSDQLVGGRTADFFGRHRRRRLHNFPAKCGQMLVDDAAVERYRILGRCGCAFDIVCIRGVAEVNGTFVDFPAALKELSKPGGPTYEQRKYPGGNRIEGSQVPDFFGLRNSPDLVDNIVRCPAGGFVYNENTGECFWRHELSG